MNGRWQPNTTEYANEPGRLFCGSPRHRWNTGMLGCNALEFLENPMLNCEPVMFPASVSRESYPASLFDGAQRYEPS